MPRRGRCPRRRPTRSCAGNTTYSAKAPSVSTPEDAQVLADVRAPRLTGGAVTAGDVGLGRDERAGLQVVHLVADRVHRAGDLVTERHRHRCRCACRPTRSTRACAGRCRRSRRRAPGPAPRRHRASGSQSRRARPRDRASVFRSARIVPLTLEGYRAPGNPSASPTASDRAEPAEPDRTQHDGQGSPPWRPDGSADAP